MTFEQLAVFVAVAERQHLTRAAEALRLSPSAVSASVKALEAFYNVRLFDRVGRGIELTSEGRTFLQEARETLSRVWAAESVLNELGGLRRGSIALQASQTIANYWLPPRLVRFHALYPSLDIRLTVGNTASVTGAVLDGVAELGFVEGGIDEPALATTDVTRDRLVVVTPADHEAAGRRQPPTAETVLELDWVMREAGSGTRTVFEAALRAIDVDPGRLRTVLTLPSNEAVLSAVRAGPFAAALSEAVVAPFVANGELAALDLPMRPRAFTMLRHKERRPSMAAQALMRLCPAAGGPALTT